jgi:hypothetical protein
LSCSYLRTSSGNSAIPRVRESRLSAINEDEKKSTEVGASAVHLISHGQTKHSACDRMLANSHAGRGPASHLEVSQTTQYKRVIDTNPTDEPITSGLLVIRDQSEVSSCSLPRTTFHPFRKTKICQATTDTRLSKSSCPKLPTDRLPHPASRVERRKPL